MSNPVSQKVAIGDYDSPDHYLKINADGSINIFAGAPPDSEAVGASATNQVLGGTGAIGDVINTMILTVATAATSTVSIKDGAGSSIPILAANTPIGVYSITLNVKSTAGAWSVTTGAGVSVLATGTFTA